MIQAIGLFGIILAVFSAAYVVVTISANVHPIADALERAFPKENHR